MVKKWCCYSKREGGGGGHFSNAKHFNSVCHEKKDQRPSTKVPEGAPDGFEEMMKADPFLSEPLGRSDRELKDDSPCRPVKLAGLVQPGALGEGNLKFHHQPKDKKSVDKDTKAFLKQLEAVPAEAGRGRQKTDREPAGSGLKQAVVDAPTLPRLKRKHLASALHKIR